MFSSVTYFIGYVATKYSDKHFDPACQTLKFSHSFHIRIYDWLILWKDNYGIYL